MLKIKLLVLALVIVLAGGLVYRGEHKSAPAVANSAQTAQAATKAVNKAKESINYCTKNHLDKNVIVSISKQHLWACEYASVKYDSPVVTGMEMYPADLTPLGTYKIYGKQTDQTLKGSDNTGSWSDPVSYWEPFLYNQYGAYGFHDATWRAAGDFGNIDINAPFTTTAKSASHGCVELPLNVAKWIYDWSAVGTTVTIQS